MARLSDSTRNGFFTLYDSIKHKELVFTKHDIPMESRKILNALSNRGYVKRTGETYIITPSGMSYIRQYHE